MEITKQKLQEIYYGNSNDKAAKILNICVPTLIKYVKEAKIPMKEKNRGRTKPFKLKII